MQHYVGIDISKRHFDLHLLPEAKPCQFENNPAGIASCRKLLNGLKPDLVVMEATGGYETALAVQLQTAGLTVAVVNPRQIRDFARAVGQIAKTDRIDAHIIARFASTVQPPARSVLDDTSRQLKAMVARRDQLIAMQVAEHNRMDHAVDQNIVRSIRQMLKSLEKQVAHISRQIAQVIECHEPPKHKADIVDSAPGRGPTTAAMLVTRLPELGQLNRRQIAALAGVAPMNRDSGAFKGKRMTGRGRAKLRAALYMPILAAIRHNPVIRTFYQRLLANGKTKMTALVAAMRKLLTILNTMIAKNQLWNPNTA